MRTGPDPRGFRDYLAQCVQIFLESIKRDVGKRELERGNEEGDNKGVIKRRKE